MANKTRNQENAMETTTQPQGSGKPPAHMLNEVGNFIRQYLVCSDYQAVILTAWVLHTWCYRAFPVTPYCATYSANVTLCSAHVSASFCQIINKDAVCFAVSAVAPIFLTTRTTFRGWGPGTRSLKEPASLVAVGFASAIVTHGSRSEIASKHAGCNAVTHCAVESKNA